MATVQTMTTMTIKLMVAFPAVQAGLDYTAYVGTALSSGALMSRPAQGAAE